MPDSAPFLDVQALCKSYPDRQASSFWRKTLRPVLKSVSFQARRGEILGLLGESGSGKSTLARCLLGLERSDSGAVLFDGMPDQAWRRAHRGAVSVVFQDYATSVNPGFTVREIIAEGLRAAGTATCDEAAAATALMDKVELPARLAGCLPPQLSGGQLQRVPEVGPADGLGDRQHPVVLHPGGDLVAELGFHHQEHLTDAVRGEFRRHGVAELVRQGRIDDAEVEIPFQEQPPGRAGVPGRDDLRQGHVGRDQLPQAGKSLLTGGDQQSGLHQTVKNSAEWAYSSRWFAVSASRPSFSFMDR